MEISKKCLAVTTLLICGITSTSYASPGVYFGVGLGQSKLNETGFDDDKGKKLFAGYQFNRYIAVEGGYTDFGSFSSSSINTMSELKGIEATVLASYPIGSRFSVFGRLGMWKWDYDTEAGGSAIQSESGSDVVHGAGVDFKFNQRFKVRGSWDEYRVNDGITNVISLNGLYTF